MHAWKEMLAAGVPMTLIYDECHQLGADKLQENWRRFHESVVTPVNARWRTIGLSATPVPTSAESHRLLRKYIFPQRPKDAPSTCHDYPFHFFHRVRNETLIASGVLCPINLVLDREGGFDFPAALLKEVIGVLRPPGPNASRLDVQDYALKFNKGVLSDSRIIEWLADRLGRSIATLGKTIVFVPTIAAANRLVALLHQRFPMIRGLVAAVHSRMAEIAVPGQEGETVHRVLDRFRSLGDKPSILVNVEMLTEGFDDPKIQSVVLARLTMSTNRFWQMIGRGTRGGPKGTTSCNVIDPVKLVRVYDYFRGYQPSLTGDVDVEFEDLEQDDGGDGRLSPQVPAVLLPPDPRACHYQVDPALGRIHAQVAAALGDFLAGGSLTEAKAVEVARLVSITFAPGIPTLVPSSEAFAPLTAAAVVLGEVSALESRTKNDLSWFRRRLPPAFDEPLLRLHLRMLRAIEQLSVWTESDFAMAQMSGAYQRAIQGEAHAAPPSANTAEAAVASVVQPSTLSPCEGAVVDIGLALAAVDGRVHPSAVIVVVESLRRMFGRAPTDELRSAVDLRRASGSDPVPLLRGEFPMRLRQLLIFQLAEVAGADGIVTPAERDHLIRTARELGVADGFVEAVLGDVSNAVPSAVAAAPSPTCSSCAFDLPTAALFCPSCGFRRS